jgi:hypothetical protein
MLGGIYGLSRVGARLYRNAVLHSGARLRPREAWAVNRRDRSRRGAGRRGCYRPARGSLDCALADSTKRACMSTHLPSSGTAPPVDGPSRVPACEFRRADAAARRARSEHPDMGGLIADGRGRPIAHIGGSSRVCC